MSRAEGTVRVVTARPTTGPAAVGDAAPGRSTRRSALAAAIALASVLAACAAPLPDAAPLRRDDPRFAAPGGGAAARFAASAVTLDAATLAERQAQLEAAWADHEADPASEEAVVWLGRRLAYVGRHDDAIAAFSHGLARHPGSAVLLRHRGHRFITVGRLDDAIDDLSRAEARLAGRPDEVEPDGLPNARGVPTSTLRSNVLYHLGLAHFLRGDFAAARPVYERCWEASRAASDDMLVAATHWLHMTLRRLGEDPLAAALLVPVHADLDVIENHAYLDVALARRGERSAEEVLAAAEPGSIEWATRAFGIANDRLCDGDVDGALALLARIESSRGWPAFGWLAAHADLVRLGVAQAPR